MTRLCSSPLALTKFYQYLTWQQAASSEINLDYEIKNASKRGKSIFTYYWTPTSLMGHPDIDLVRLQEPSFSSACWNEMPSVVGDIKSKGIGNLYTVTRFESISKNFFSYNEKAKTKIKGCMDKTARNYNENAEVDDGSCVKRT